MEIVIWVCLFFGIIMLLMIYGFGKEQDDSRELFQSLENLVTRDRHVATIISVDNYSPEIQVSKSKYLNLSNEIGLYTIKSDNESVWAGFKLERSGTDGRMFTLNNVVFSMDKKRIEANLILLFEKVSSQKSPPYGNRYFNTKSYNGFDLKGGVDFFEFQCRFDFDLNQLRLIKESDTLEVSLMIDDKSTGGSEQIVLSRALGDSRFKKIFETDEIITWHG